MIPTPDPELNDVLGQLRRGIEDVLGAQLVGLYLQGSFALGDYDQDSDVDFIAVTEEAPTADDAETLAGMHERIFSLPSEWGRHLEGSYFSREQLLAPAPPSIHDEGGKVWYLDHGSTRLERSSHCNTLVVRWTLYHHAVPLAGPEIRTLLTPIAPQALRSESRQTLLDWGQDILKHPERYASRFYQGLIVLTCCRVLHTVETGAIHSKKAGAEWAKRTFPERWHGLIDRTWSTRHDPYTSSRTAADKDDYRATLEVVRYSVEKLRG